MGGVLSGGRVKAWGGRWVAGVALHSRRGGRCWAFRAFSSLLIHVLYKQTWGGFRSSKGRLRVGTVGLFFIWGWLSVPCRRQASRCSSPLLPVNLWWISLPRRSFFTIGCRKQIGWHGLCYHHVLEDVDDELASVDVDEGKLNDETPDLEHGSPFMKMPNAVCRKGYLVTANSNLVIITAGTHQEGGETHLNLIHWNVTIFDVLTYYPIQSPWLANWLLFLI